MKGHLQEEVLGEVLVRAIWASQVGYAEDLQPTSSKAFKGISVDFIFYQTLWSLHVDILHLEHFGNQLLTTTKPNKMAKVCI